jgi:hypothetical protein
VRLPSRTPPLPRACIHFPHLGSLRIYPQRPQEPGISTLAAGRPGSGGEFGPGREGKEAGHRVGSPEEPGGLGVGSGLAWRPGESGVRGEPGAEP